MHPWSRYAKAVVCVVGLFLCFSADAQADNTVCSGAIFIIPDGSIHEGTFTGVNQERWFRFGAKANRSYAIMSENLNPSDVSLGAGAQIQHLDACGGNSLTVHPITFTEPAPANSGGIWARRALLTTSNTDVFVQLGGSTGEAFRVRVVETTQFSPLWSTFGNFESFYRFQNTTNESINVTLILINDAGTTRVNTTFTMLANTTTNTRNTGPTDFNIPDNEAGQAIIMHDGPPGAIQVDGFLGLFSGSQTIVLPVKILPARQQR